MKKSLLVVLSFLAIVGQVMSQTLNIRPVQAVAIDFQGVAGATYVIQASPDLTNWVNLAAIQGNKGNFSFTNFPPAGSGHLFYRSIFASDATAILSLDAASPTTMTVPVDNTTIGQSLGLTVLVFDVGAKNGVLHLHDLKVNISAQGSGFVTAAYLYHGSTRISSASALSGQADFGIIADNTEGATIPADSTAPYIVKVDLTSFSRLTVTAWIADNDTQTIYDPFDLAVPVYGSAIGNAVTVLGAGPAFSLTGSSSVNMTVSSDGTNEFKTYAFSFPVSVFAVGQNVTLWMPNSQRESFIWNTVVLVNGDKVSLDSMNASTSCSAPLGAVLSGDGKSFTVPSFGTATFTLTYIFSVKSPVANLYAVEIEGID